jgi:4-amino-4-deoxy-L-arabinose transferase-like glycosyltransferase
MCPSAAATVSARSDRLQRYSWIDLLAVVFVAVSLSAIYCSRLATQSLVGEETRWGSGAREMLATGDWVVPRQQGRVFAERPPMTMWAMAAAGWFRGDVDLLAIRLPSAVAVVLTALLIFAYTRAFASTTAATLAAIAYGTMGQVLQIGRQGESEALFALFVGGSLLMWHLGYLRQWPKTASWSIGFTLAALGALTKGPQAPVYFVAITGVYLAVRRDWRYLFSWQFATGGAVFAAVVAAWQIPFYRATDWWAVVATWSGLASDRIRLSGLAEHAFRYPIETFVCVLPWSPIFVALAKRETRALLSHQHNVVSFLLIAFAVAYPTVWLAAGARGRYFMPLYPLAAVLAGLILERCAIAAVGTYPRRAWRQFLALWATIIGAGGVVVAVAGLFANSFAGRFYQPRWFAIAFLIVCLSAVVVLWRSYQSSGRSQPVFGALAIAAVAGVGVVGLMVNVNVACWLDPSNEIAAMKNELPASASLVSFSPIEHRFAYYFHDPIAEIDWPRRTSDLPADVEYFCFMRQPGDNAESRAAGRGRSWYKTPGTLPFEWEEITTICVERQVYAGEPPRKVVIGRIIRPLKVAVSDVSVPRRR